MKNRKQLSYLPLVALAILLASCNGRVEKTDGSVLLLVNSVNGGAPPFNVTTTSGPFSMGDVSLANVSKDPAILSTSPLQAIELRSYEVRFTRRDTGTRTPPTLVMPISGLIPVDNSRTVFDVIFLTSDQVRNLPLDDLRRRGVDSETGSAVVVLTVSVRFFGRTVSGNDVATDPASFNIEVRQ